MPKGKQKASTSDKQVKKIVEDKTFGLKNKNKSAKVNKYVQQVESQMSMKGRDRRAEKEAEQRKLEKERKKQLEMEDRELFKTVPTKSGQKVDASVDPKSVLCEFFKAGLCTKGSKCKFSHDLNIARKTEKINLFADLRDSEEATEGTEETEDDAPREKKLKAGSKHWDKNTLSTVVKAKHANENKPTNIVCKFFLDAVDKGIYGWFWLCPNGTDCKYRHALPPDYKFKSQVAEEDSDDIMTLEESLEAERAELKGGTPVTEERLMKWREEKRLEREKMSNAAEKTRQEDIKAGRRQMTGRDVFNFNPDAANQDDDEAMNDYGERQDKVDDRTDGYDEEEADIQEDLFDVDDDDEAN